MKARYGIAALVMALGMAGSLALGFGSRGLNRGNPPPEAQSSIRRGFQIAPVPLNLEGKNPAAVGRGSYLVNAIGGCNDCHTCPSYAPGHSPYMPGEPGQINTDNYLAGGVPFGPFTSRNITPDDSGRPAGLTEDEFLQVLRTGHDPDGPEGSLLQVMPWPIYRNMTDRDIRSIYAYLSSIPHAEPGECAGAGQ